MPNIKPQELLIILVIVLVLFGGSKLPQLARNLGQAQKEFKSGLNEASDSKNGKDESKSKDKSKSKDESEDSV